MIIYLRNSLFNLMSIPASFLADLTHQNDMTVTAIIDKKQTKFVLREKRKNSSKIQYDHNSSFPQGKQTR